MAQLNFGGVIENVMTREEFPLEKAREILKDETIAVIGYGVQGPGQACNLRDNGFNVIVGQLSASGGFMINMSVIKAFLVSPLKWRSEEHTSELQSRE